MILRARRRGRERLETCDASEARHADERRGERVLPPKARHMRGGGSQQVLALNRSRARATAAP